MNRNLVLGTYYFNKVDSNDLRVIVYALDAIIGDKTTPDNLESNAVVLKDYIQSLLLHRKESGDTN